MRNISTRVCPRCRRQGRRDASSRQRRLCTILSCSHVEGKEETVSRLVRAVLVVRLVSFPSVSVVWFSFEFVLRGFFSFAYNVVGCFVRSLADCFQMIVELDAARRRIWFLCCRPYFVGCFVCSLHFMMLVALFYYKLAELLTFLIMLIINIRYVTLFINNLMFIFTKYESIQTSPNCKICFSFFEKMTLASPKTVNEMCCDCEYKYIFNNVP